MTEPESQLTVATGLDGLIGSHLTRMAGPGFPIASLGEWGSGFDIADPGLVEAALDRFPEARTLLHLAAFTDTQAAYEQSGNREGDCYRVNVLGTRNVARACTERGIHLITVSTDYVFSGDSELPYRETDVAEPMEWYGETKYLAEQETRQTPSWTIARLAFPYGAVGTQAAGLLGKVLAAYAQGGTLRLFGDQLITPTYLDDIARGIQLICLRRPQNEVFHLAGADWITPFDFGQAAAQVFGLSSERFEESSLKALSGEQNRRRHRELRLDTSKWRAYAVAQGCPAPVGIAEGLRLSKESMEGETTRA